MYDSREILLENDVDNMVVWMELRISDKPTHAATTNQVQLNFICYVKIAFSQKHISCIQIMRWVSKSNSKHNV